MILALLRVGARTRGPAVAGAPGERLGLAPFSALGKG